MPATTIANSNRTVDCDNGYLRNQFLRVATMSPIFILWSSHTAEALRTRPLFTIFMTSGAGFDNPARTPNVRVLETTRFMTYLSH